MLQPQQIAFLANGLLDDPAQPQFGHVIAKTGKAFTTNRHVAYITTHPYTLTDKVQCVDNELKPVRQDLSPPDIDRLIEYGVKNPVKVLIDLGMADEILILCAAAEGVNKRFERLWKKEPRKTRSTSPPNAGVVLYGDDYGLYVEVQSRSNKPFRVRLAEAACQSFRVCFDPGYLSDALEAFGAMGKGTELTVEQGNQTGPAFFNLPTYEGSGYTAMVMPRRM